ncbi:MAG TPA: chromate efflux transporter [Candidatus Binatia bacterium]|jgi:chromate transporter|nr:chromate efflux transporter [Candidatus Binatia bacterium]
MHEGNKSQAPHVGEARATSLKELALLFFRLGTTAFGGPAAHIAMMEDEVVRRRGWLSREHFLDLLGATNLIPGPNSTEMAIHIGHHRAGWAGLVVAGTCFILPAACITLAFAWAYDHLGSLPQAEGFMYGVKPVIIAVVVQALWRLGQSALKTTRLTVIALLATAANFLGVNELLVLCGAGVITALVDRLADDVREVPPVLSVVGLGTPLLVNGGGMTAATLTTPFGLIPLFLFFVKVGAILFGSGYVLLAFLRADLVDRWQWLTESQLLDAVAVGQITPGPVFTTATFIGYLLGGTPGAVVATCGVFLPAFLFVALSGPLIPRLRRSATAGAVLDGVNVASLALMAVVTWHLGRAAMVDGITAVLALVSAVLLMRFRLNSAWLVLGGGLVGLSFIH